METIVLRVLSVEDDFVAYKILEVILAPPHFVTPQDRVTFELQWARSLHEARARLGESNFDVILLDLYMPGVVGFEALEALAKEFPRIPIIVVTAAESNEIGSETMAHGAQDYLPKSTLNQVGLVRSISHALARKRWIEQGNDSIEYDRRIFDDLTNLREMRKIQEQSGIIRG